LRPRKFSVAFPIAPQSKIKPAAGGNDDMSAVEYLNPPGLPPAQGLYSQAGRGDPKTLVFVAGQLSVGDNGEVVGKGDFARQFEQVFANLDGVLKGIGADYSAVVKFTTFLVEPDDIDTFVKLRAAWFPRLYPARVYPPNTLLIVKRLVKAEFLLEVEAVVSLAK
jgi:enamine deaminase RidA (YjgF/YER057c/UK114 family)